MLDALPHLDREELAPLLEGVRAFTTEPGALRPEARVALMREAARVSEGVAAAPVAVVDTLTDYTRKVAGHAYRVEDADAEALRRAGVSEDAIFEATLAASLGVSLHRLEKGLALLGPELGER
ncbi:MAG: hypothetical protein H6741_14735 [Alphaproteobacteria bacterium]|nr:hypothetical protein [Alphaproteobacteria bacterium]MCB9793974.1 hypothetical protein [Alphaproteobacteria bacterium]